MNEQNEVYKAIVAIQGALSKTGIAKERKNQQQGYSFRGIDDLYFAVAPHLAEHQLCIIPRYVTRTVVEHEAKSGAALFYVTVEGEFDFVSAIDGSRHTARMFGEAMDSADKATNKAASAAFKYLLLQTFCIPTEGDNDADSHTPEPLARRQQEQPQSAAKPALARPAPSQSKEAASLSMSWKEFVVPKSFPKTGGMKLSELDKDQLGWFIENFKVQTKDKNGNEKKQAWIDADLLFRAMLDEAKKEVGDSIPF